MLKAEIRLENPGATQLSMTVTMTLNEWKSLQADLGSKYPTWQLSAAINELVSKANTAFSTEHASVT